MIVTPGRCGRRTDGRCTLDPATSGLSIRNHVQTGAPAIAAASRIAPPSGQHAARSARIGTAGGAPSARLVAVDNPTLFFAASAQASPDRQRRGRGRARGGHRARSVTIPCTTRERRLRRSAPQPLSEMAVRLMKVSQNLYAETLLMTMSEGRPSTAVTGRAAMQAVLAPWGSHRRPDPARRVWPDPIRLRHA